MRLGILLLILCTTRLYAEFDPLFENDDRRLRLAPPRNKLESIVLDAFIHVDKEYNSSKLRTELLGSNGADSSTFSEARERAFIAEVLVEVAEQVDSVKSDDVASYLSEMCPRRDFRCATGKYRSVDGSCNNPLHPQWGATFSTFLRILPNSYKNGISLPPNGPPPHHLVRVLETVSQTSSTPYTRVFASFFEFVLRDIAKIASFRKEEFGASIGECCRDSPFNCMQVRSDSPFSLHNCRSHYRTLPTRDEKCQLGAREQANLATAFIDAGQVYGNTEEEQTARRTYQKGMLKEGGHEKLFTSQSTTIIDDVLIRYHNVVVEKLANVNPGWPDEKLFEEGRRIAVAVLQHIVYSEMLPILLGTGLSRKRDLLLPSYDIKHEVGTINEISVLGPALIAQLTSTDDVLEHSKLESELKEPLFINKKSYATDMPHENSPLLHSIVLGRDHGVADYFQWRKFCKKHVGTHYPKDDVTRMVDDLYKEDYSRHGDAFFYDNDEGLGSFSEEQLKIIKETTFASLLCDSKSVNVVQPRAFELPDENDNHPLHCNTSHFTLKVELWKEDALFKDAVASTSCTKVIELARRMAEQESTRLSENIERMQGSFGDFDPVSAYGRMMKPHAEAVEISSMSRILLHTTRMLLDGSPMDDGSTIPSSIDKTHMHDWLSQIDVPSIFSFAGNDSSTEKCIPHSLPCDPTNPFRSHSGWCNNLHSPHFGSSFRPMRRLLPPAYDDGFDVPRLTSVSGNPLPNPRLISNKIHIDRPIEHAKFSHMMMQFGQFITHDVTHAPMMRGPQNEVLNCSICDSHKTISEDCYPIPIPMDDPFFDPLPEGLPKCLPFTRSVPGQTTLGYRNQINQLTSFIDASVVYGSTDCEADALRSGHGGQLRVTSADVGILLPQNKDDQDCASAPKFPCFLAGDERSSHLPILTVLQVIFLREHNRIAEALSEINSHWDDERIYQETRKIVSAELQHVIYSEYLPKVLGAEVLEKHDLKPKRHGYFTGYDEFCDATISHPFATASFRFGHSTARRVFARYNSHYENRSEPLDMADHFNNVEAIYETKAGGAESLLLGMVGTPMMAVDTHVTSGLRNHLFAARGQEFSGYLMGQESCPAFYGSKSLVFELNCCSVSQIRPNEGRCSGMDLISINIMRGRDHGVNSYNDYRELCGFGRATSFGDLGSAMADSTVDMLKDVYEHVDDIDLFTGGLSERVLPGALVGPTVGCILAEQFGKLKKCDRFYYENDSPYTAFTLDQLDSIRQVTLASIFCQNAHIKRIQPDIFTIPNQFNNYPVSCASFAKLDLKAWKDADKCGSGWKYGNRKRVTACSECVCTREGKKCQTIRVKDCTRLADLYSYDEIEKDISCLMQCGGRRSKHY